MTLRNDNFLDMNDEFERRVYSAMKAHTLHCRHVSTRTGKPCYCAYSHHHGVCRKCGHFTRQLMLPLPEKTS